jgi:hypothetical protein
MVIKWETLKDKAATAAVGHDLPYTYEKLAPYGLLACIENMAGDLRGRVEELKTRTRQVIAAWDIRRVKTLIELFPGIVPVKFAKSTPTCFMADDAHAEWFVEFGEPRYNAADNNLA